MSLCPFFKTDEPLLSLILNHFLCLCRVKAEFSAPPHQTAREVVPHTDFQRCTLSFMLISTNNFQLFIENYYLILHLSSQCRYYPKVLFFLQKVLFNKYARSFHYSNR